MVPSNPAMAAGVVLPAQVEIVPYVTFPFAGRRGTTVIDRSTAYPLFGERARTSGRRSRRARRRGPRARAWRQQPRVCAPAAAARGTAGRAVRLQPSGTRGVRRHRPATGAPQATRVLAAAARRPPVCACGRSGHRHRSGAGAGGAAAPGRPAGARQHDSERDRFSSGATASPPPRARSMSGGSTVSRRRNSSCSARDASRRTRGFTSSRPPWRGSAARQGRRAYREGRGPASFISVGPASLPGGRRPLLRHGGGSLSETARTAPVSKRQPPPRASRLEWC